MRCLLACLLLGCASTHGIGDASVDGARADAWSATDARAVIDGAQDACAQAIEAELAAFRERVIRTWCERIDPCNDWRRWPDLESCMQYEAGARFAASGWSHTAEGEVLDLEVADACLAGLECPYLIGWPFGVVTDPLPYRCAPFRRLCAGEPARLGARCVSTRQCDADLFCESLECDTCQPRVPTGGPCRDGNAAHTCMPGSSGELALCETDAAGEPYRCRLGRVTAPAGEGEPCGPMGLPSDVLDLVPCADGLQCVMPVAASAVPGRCERPGALGEPCNEAGCALGLRCEWSSSICSEPQVVVPIAVGAPCSEEVHRFTCDGQWGTECVDGVCVASRGEGQACDSFWSDWDPFRVSPCDPPLRCIERRCLRPTLGLGAPCDSSDLCESSCCDYDARVCAPIDVCWPEDPRCTDR